MRSAVRICLIVSIIITQGCTRRVARTEALDPVLQRIGGVDVVQDHYPSYSEYKDRVSRQLREIVRDVCSPSTLRALHLECERIHRTAPETPQEHLTWLNSYHEAGTAVLFRLAELDSEEATRHLVGLLADERLSWDGESALNIGNAISRCRKKALPYLKQVRADGRRRFAERIAECIERGELFGP